MRRSHPSPPEKCRHTRAASPAHRLIVHGTVIIDFVCFPYIFPGFNIAKKRRGPHPRGPSEPLPVLLLREF
jgi:hypothetical protein